MEADGYMVCDSDTGGERVMEYLACLDRGNMMFRNEVVVMYRVGIQFSKKGVGSVCVGWDREAATDDNEFKRIDHIQE